MKKKERPVELQPLGGVYRVPLKRVFNKKKLDATKTWDDVYGRTKCIACKRHLKEGDAYTVLGVLKKDKEGNETYEIKHKYKHVNCT
jgi:hypothetical protein